MSSGSGFRGAKRWQQDDADALDALLREREALRAALAGHAIQCPQCQDVASRAALTTSPEEKATP